MRYIRVRRSGQVREEEAVRGRSGSQGSRQELYVSQEHDSTLVQVMRAYSGMTVFVACDECVRSLADFVIFKGSCVFMK